MPDYLSAWQQDECDMACWIVGDGDRNVDVADQEIEESTFADPPI